MFLYDEVTEHEAARRGRALLRLAAANGDVVVPGSGRRDREDASRR
jgi:hypothetical protein